MMIDKLYRFIFIGSLTILGLCIFSLLLGRLFFDDYKNSGAIERLVGILVLVAPFTPIGTLFGTLKEDQTTSKKITIVICTGLSVLFLLVFIWGLIFAAAFAKP